MALSRGSNASQYRPSAPAAHEVKDLGPVVTAKHVLCFDSRQVIWEAAISCLLEEGRHNKEAVRSDRDRRHQRAEPLGMKRHPSGQEGRTVSRPRGCRQVRLELAQHVLAAAGGIERRNRTIGISSPRVGKHRSIPTSCSLGSGLNKGVGPRMYINESQST